MANSVEPDQTAPLGLSIQKLRIIMVLEQGHIVEIFGEILQFPWCQIYMYSNDPKFLDRQVWANSADPDQTAPRRAV